MTHEYVPATDIQLFVANPLEEERRGWNDVIVCRLCGLKGKRLATHLLVHRQEMAEWPGNSLSEKYKRHFGYSKNAPLSSKYLLKKCSERMKKRNQRAKFGRQPPLGNRFQKKRTNKKPGETLAHVQARLDWGASNGQNSLTISEAAKLLGVSVVWIYKHTYKRSKCPIPHSYSRPGRDSTTGRVLGPSALVFERGKILEWALSRPRTGQDRLGTYHVKEELARRLNISVRRLHGLLQGTLRHPLPRHLAEKLLTSTISLRSECQGLGSTAKGGRPKTLLPSEEKELPGKYQSLKSDLGLMLSWADEEVGVITLATLGEWMCQQSRLGNLQVLLFWPSLHTQLPAICEDSRNRFRGGLAAAERAKELLCKEYAISPRALDRAIASKLAA
jgi:hypothetical protein